MTAYILFQLMPFIPLLASKTALARLSMDIVKGSKRPLSKLAHVSSIAL